MVDMLDVSLPVSPETGLSPDTSLGLSPDTLELWPPLKGLWLHLAGLQGILGPDAPYPGTMSNSSESDGATFPVLQQLPHRKIPANTHPTSSLDLLASQGPIWAPFPLGKDSITTEIFV